MSDCTLCHGAKVIRASIAERIVSGVEWHQCPHCRGTGKEPPIADEGPPFYWPSMEPVLKREAFRKDNEKLDGLLKDMREKNLEAFGFGLPEAKARGREKVGKADVEVHRAGPNEFSILRTNAKGERTEERAKLVDVREVWLAIGDILSRGEVAVRIEGKGDLAKGFPMTYVLSARQVMTRLRERASPESPMTKADVSAWQGGENRARIYFPLYYRPVLVLAHYYRVVERPSASSRFLRIVKPFEKLDEGEEKKVEGTTLGDDWGKESI